MLKIPTRLLLVAAVVWAVGACDDATRPEFDIGFPSEGASSRLVAGMGRDTIRIIAGRAGTAHVSVCGVAESDLELIVADSAVDAATNCETITFAAGQGQTYRAIVRALTTSGGPYNYCWRIGEPCTVTTAVASPTGTPPGYYEFAEGKTDAAFLAALNDIIDNQRVFSYDVARDSLYLNVDDPDNDDVIIDIYNGRAAPGVNSRATAATANLNAEHSWPQSLGAGQSPAMSDLNILYSADAGANGERSNLPFGIVGGTVLWPAIPPASGEYSKRGFQAGTSGRIVFEPRASKKGDIARALAYFYVRYSLDPTSSFTTANFEIELPRLAEWSQADPPDAFEIARNNLVYRVQGNRNPFIDHPEWVPLLVGIVD